ncbi:MAG: flippase [Ignavibacteriales bacterium]|nr:flippase [Ignavibacteriales bacterium]
MLGPEKYGLINFAAAFTGYFTILTDYGFNLSATQEISINRDDKQKVSEIFSSVISIKILFFLLSSLIFLIVVFFIPLFNENMILFFVTFLGVLGTTMFPSWLYQGVERMKYILTINLSVRIIITILIFIVIKSESDYLKLAALNTIAQFSIGVVGIRLAFKKLKIKYFFPIPELIKAQLKNGLSLFLSTVSINLYTTSNIFILGLFAPLNVVGYFSAADKIRMACQSILSPMSQSVFPFVNKLLSESYERFINFNKKLLKIAFTIGAFISILLFHFAEPIVKILLGHEYQSSILVLKIIAWLPLVIFLSNVLGIQTMLPLNKQKALR